MKLTADVLLSAKSGLNADGRRELDLSGHRVVEIENLGITRDLYEVINLNNNNIRVLDNIPKLLRLKGLFLAKNGINVIGKTTAENAPNLDTLVLTSNTISRLSELNALSGLSHLEYLSLVGNPVCGLENYRSYVIWRLPSLRILDYSRVRESERHAAQELFGSHEEPSDLVNAMLSGTTTGIQPEVGPERKQRIPSTKVAATTVNQEERAALLEQLQRATSMNEMQAIERKLDQLR